MIEELKRPGRLDEDRVEAIKALFPEAFQDGVFNAQVLKELLDGPSAPASQDTDFYGLNWPGKKQARKLAFRAANSTLKPIGSYGNADDTNILIIGENLETLKILRNAYANSIKLIYIDPPYNTGNDFVYNDDFGIKIEQYLENTGQSDSSGVLVSNPRSSGRFHSRWLDMMYSRLLLAKQFLRDDGTILVSINDVEFANLKIIMDEIFGEENFVTTFIWNNEGNIDQQSKIKVNHEFIMLYTLDADKFKRPSTIDPNIEESSKIYNDAIENTIIKNGPANPPSRITIPVGFPADFESGEIEIQTSAYPYIHSKAVVKEYKVEESFEIESGWSSKNLLLLFINNGFSEILDSEGKKTKFYLRRTGAIYMRKVRSEEQGHVLSVLRNFGTSKQSSNLLKEWGLEFSFPKPIYLIQYLCQIFTNRNDHDIVMDFFAGSGTSAHAVLRQNKADGGNRKFICIQMPESYNIGDEDKVISDTTKKRIELSIDAETGGQAGFRVYSLTSSNIRKWSTGYFEIGDLTPLLRKSVVIDDYKAQNVLTEMMLLEGFPLDSKIEQAPEFDDQVYVVSHPERSHRLLISLTPDTLSDQTVEQASQYPKDTFICLESSLTDQSKIRLADAVAKVKTL